MPSYKADYTIFLLVLLKGFMFYICISDPLGVYSIVDRITESKMAIQIPQYHLLKCLSFE